MPVAEGARETILICKAARWGAPLDYGEVIFGRYWLSNVERSVYPR